MEYNIVVLFFMLFFAFRRFREKRFKAETRWIFPAMVLYFVAETNVKAFFYPGPVMVMIASFAVGGTVGLMRGRLMSVRMDDETGDVMTKSSAMSTILFLATYAAKVAVDYAVRNTGNTAAIRLIPSSLMMIGAGTIVFKSVYLYAKYFRMKNISAQ